MTFNETLRQLRERAGLTQAGLAQKAEVPLRTIQGWEQGYRCPVSQDFFRLVKALGVSADEFISAEDATANRRPETKPSRGRPQKARAGGIGFENSRVDNPPKKPRGKSRKEGKS